MNSLGRISLLFGALVLLVFGVVCLKQQISPEPVQGDSVSPDSAGTVTDVSESPSQQPMILSSSGFRENERTRPVELSPVQLSGNHAEEPGTPVQAPFLNGPMKNNPNDGYPDSAPLREDSPMGVSAAVLLAPVEVNSFATESTTANGDPAFNSANDSASAEEDRASGHTLPQTVVTVADDSLWNISKRLYGRGDFYKALWLHNQSVIQRPDRMLPGVRLVAPNVEELRQLYPDACPASENTSAPNS